MKAKIFTLRFNSESRLIDDQSLQDFLAGRQLTSMSDHLVEYDNEPMLVVAITYRDDPGPIQGGGQLFPRKVNPRDELDDTDKVVYDALRLWRNKRAEAAGGPGYIVLTNLQIAELARIRPRSLAQIGTIPGIGESRLALYGREILEQLAEYSVAGTSVDDGNKQHE